MDRPLLDVVKTNHSYGAYVSEQPAVKRVHIPEVGFCQEKKRLLDEFLKAIQQIIAIHNQQTRAVIDGDPDFYRYDVMLYLAQEEKERAKYAWISHVDAHGCEG